MNVKEIMTKNPIYGTPATSLPEIAQMMIDNDCGCIPIVNSDEAKNPIGMITDRDIVVRTVAENRNPLECRAEDAMSGEVITVAPETSVEECCNLMENKQIRRIAVVDGEGALCGMVAQADIAINASTDKTAEVVQEVSKAAAS